MIEENIVQLPSLLDRLASKLTNYLSQEAANRQEWIAIQEGICLTLVEARDQFTANVEFGHWCDAEVEGINHQTRAAAIAMGREPQALRKCLEATERRSLRTIHQFDFGRFTNAGKTKEQPTGYRRQNPSPKTNAIRDAVRPLVEDNQPINRDQFAGRFDASPSTVERAIYQEAGRLEGLREAAALDPAEMTQTIRKRYEAALRKARKELREEITAEINSVYDVYVKRRHERDVWAERIIASHKGLISKDAFRKIKACLHPDHNTFAHAADALRIFSDLEKILVKPDEPAAGPPLPTTAAELMARRREYQGKHC